MSKMPGSTARERLQETLQDARRRYIQNNKISETLHKEATNTLPGGNTRTVLHADPFPIYMRSGNGYQVTSEDGQTYVTSTNRQQPMIS